MDCNTVKADSKPASIYESETGQVWNLTLQ
jgi:hypothetical protein